MYMEKWFNAAKTGTVGELKQLSLKYSKQRDERGWTALMNAAYEGKIDNIQFLMEKERDVHSPTNYTALMIAVERGNEQAVRVLTCQSKVRIQSKDAFYQAGTTALAIAMQCQNVPMVNYLLNYETEAAGLTQMHINAFQHRTTEILNACRIQVQQNIDALGRLPIVYMTFLTPTPQNEPNYKNALRAMARLPETFHTHKKDRYGLTAMHYAVIYNNKPAIEVLGEFYEANGIFVPQNVTIEMQREPIEQGNVFYHNQPLNLRDVAATFRASPPPSSAQMRSAQSSEKAESVVHRSQTGMQENQPSPINFNLRESLRQSRLADSGAQGVSDVTSSRLNQPNDLLMSHGASPDQIDLNTVGRSLRGSRLCENQLSDIERNDQVIKSRLQFSEQENEAQLQRSYREMMQRSTRNLVAQLQQSTCVAGVPEALQALAKSRSVVAEPSGAGEVTPSFSDAQQRFSTSRAENNEIGVESLKGKLKLLSSEYKALDREHDELELRYAAAIGLVETQKTMIRKLKTQIFDLENDGFRKSLLDDKLRSKMENQRNDIFELEKRLFCLQEQQQQAGEVATSLQKELELKILECDNLRSLLEQTAHEGKKLQVERGIYVDKLETLQSRLQEALEGSAAVGSVALENTQLHAQVIELQELNDRLTGELTHFKAQNEALAAELQTSKALLASQRVIAEIDDELGGAVIAEERQNNVGASNIEFCGSGATHNNGIQRLASAARHPGEGSLALSQLGGRGGQEISNLQQQLETAETARNEAENRTKNLQIKYDQLLNMYNQLQEEVETLETQLEAKRMQIERLEIDLQNSVSDLDFDIVQQQNDALRADNGALSERLQDMERKLLEAENNKQMILKEYVDTKAKMLRLQKALGLAEADGEDAEIAALMATQPISGTQNEEFDEQQEEDKDVTIQNLRTRLATAERNVHAMRAKFKAWMRDLIE